MIGWEKSEKIVKNSDIYLNLKNSAKNSSKIKKSNKNNWDFSFH